MKFLNDWKDCDGYVQDARTAIILLMLSSCVSLVLLQVVEKAKLFIFQRAETAYESKSFEKHDPNVVLRTSHLNKTYNGTVKAV